MHIDIITYGSWRHENHGLPSEIQPSNPINVHVEVTSHNIPLLSTALPSSTQNIPIPTNDDPAGNNTHPYICSTSESRQQEEFHSAQMRRPELGNSLLFSDNRASQSNILIDY